MTMRERIARLLCFTIVPAIMAALFITATN